MWDGGIGNKNISTGTEKYDSCRNQGGRGRREILAPLEKYDPHRNWG